MSTNKPLTVDDALQYLENYKASVDVDQLTMVEVFLLGLKEQQTSLQVSITPQEASTITHPALRAAPMGLFPTMSSLQQVIDLANSQLPVQTPNEMLGLLMIYHNSLLYQVECCKAKD